VAVALGYMLGESLATAVRDGRMSRDALRHLVLQPRGDGAIASLLPARRLARDARLSRRRVAGPHRSPRKQRRPAGDRRPSTKVRRCFGSGLRALASEAGAGSDGATQQSSVPGSGSGSGR
jgi:hypothetical protein